MQQPLSVIEGCCIPCDDIQINMKIISDVEEYHSTKTDRMTMIKQQLTQSVEIELENLFQLDDKVVLLCGVASIGKTTTVDAYKLKWAKNKLPLRENIDFVFVIKCQEINVISSEIATTEGLFKKLFPEVFDIITLDDLSFIAGKVVIILDGLDELKGFHNLDTGDIQSNKHAKFVRDIVDDNSNFLKGHKSILSGRSNTCEFIKSSLAINKVKIVEVCGPNSKSIPHYIRYCLGQEDVDKIRMVQQVINTSQNLKVLTSLPIFLWTICHLISEKDMKISSHTELYFYTCLILVINHSKRYEKMFQMDFEDIINDENMMKNMYGLMLLSLQTYMNDQVIFSIKDIEEIPVKVNLEQTGLVVKYQENMYQFIHNELHEFFYGLHFHITKQVSPYIKNPRFNDCLATITGIDRLLEDKSNKLFSLFFGSLQRIHSQNTFFFSRIQSWFFSKIYLQTTISKTLPRSMRKGQTLYINLASKECQEYIHLLHQTKFDISGPGFTSAEIQNIPSDIDKQIVLNILSQLKITKVKLPTTFVFEDKHLIIKDGSIIFAELVYEGKLSIEFPEIIDVKFNVSIASEFRSQDITSWVYLLNQLESKIILPTYMSLGDNLNIRDCQECLNFMMLVNQGDLQVVDSGFNNLTIHCRNKIDYSLLKAILLKLNLSICPQDSYTKTIIFCGFRTNYKAILPLYKANSSIFGSSINVQFCGDMSRYSENVIELFNVFDINIRINR